MPRPSGAVPALPTARQGASKIFPASSPRNPLKSRDSDERIQGNPRQSNPHERGSSPPHGHEPRKPKRIDRSDVADAAEKEPNRLPPNAKALASRGKVRTRGVAQSPDARLLHEAVERARLGRRAAPLAERLDPDCD